MNLIEWNRGPQQVELDECVSEPKEVWDAEGRVGHRGSVFYGTQWLIKVIPDEAAKKARSS